MTKVRCTVDSCQFWGKDQFCTADQIWVRNDICGDADEVESHFINATEVEFGKDFTESEKVGPKVSLQSETAKTSPQTCCDTMKPKQ